MEIRLLVSIEICQGYPLLKLSSACFTRSGEGGEITRKFLTVSKM